MLAQADSWIPAFDGMTSVEGGAACGRPHQFDSRSAQHSRAVDPDFEPTYARSRPPAVYSPRSSPIPARTDEVRVTRVGGLRSRSLGFVSDCRGTEVPTALTPSARQPHRRSARRRPEFRRFPLSRRRYPRAPPAGSFAPRFPCTGTSRSPGASCCARGHSTRPLLTLPRPYDRTKNA